MSGHGGRRAGNSRKKVFEIKAAAAKFWQKGKTRIWIDSNLYLAWFSARTKCLKRFKFCVPSLCSGKAKNVSIHELWFDEIVFLYVNESCFFVGLIRKKES